MIFLIKNKKEFLSSPALPRALGRGGGGVRRGGGGGGGGGPLFGFLLGFRAPHALARPRFGPVAPFLFGGFGLRALRLALGFGLGLARRAPYLWGHGRLCLAFCLGLSVVLALFAPG